MKKSFIFLTVIAAVLSVFMSSCSKPSNAIVGSWKFSYMEYQGLTITVADIESNPSLSIIFSGVLDARLVFNDNGTVVSKLLASTDEYTYVADDATKEIRIYDNGDTGKVFTMYMTDDLKYIYASASSFIVDDDFSEMLNSDALLGNVYFEKE